MGSKLKFAGVLAVVVVAALVLAAVRLGYLGRREVVIAFIDTGISLKTKPELASRTLPGWNFHDGNADTEDKGNHGTRVAALAAAVCAECKLLPVKVARFGGALRPDDLARAIRYAVEHHAQVINISLGVAAASQELRYAVAEAKQADVIIVAAAGVGVPNPFRPLRLETVYPQAYEDLIVVGSSERTDRPDDLQNFGDPLDLSVHQSRTGPNRSWSFGSSFAAGEISGYVARRLQAGGSLDLRSMRQLLRASTSAPPKPDFGRVGYGYFDASAFGQGRPEAVTHRIYRSPEGVSVDFNARDEIEAVGGAWACAGSPAQAPAPTENALRKGRARLLLPPPPAESCVLKVELKTAGKTLTLEISA
jgi:subtilisin family serine protease